MKKTFVCEEHKEYGGLGWRPLSNPDFDPLPGMGVAHDCLEHARDTTESVDDELQAFGAMLHVRGAAYFARRNSANTSPSFHMCGEVADMLRKIEFCELPPIANHSPLKCADIDAELDALVERIREFIKVEYEYQENPMSLTPETERNIRAWMIVGYRKACRRYRDVDALQMFWDIEELADRYLRQAEEGDRLIVSVRNGEAFVDFRSQFD